MNALRRVAPLRDGGHGQVVAGRDAIAARPDLGDEVRPSRIDLDASADELDRLRCLGEGPASSVWPMALKIWSQAMVTVSPSRSNSMPVTRPSLGDQAPRLHVGSGWSTPRVWASSCS